MQFKADTDKSLEELEAMFTNTKNQSQFYPEQDVIKRTDDGREIVVARAGSPLPMEKARELGLIKDEESGKKAAAPSENKSVTPTKTKEKTDADKDKK